MDCVTDGEKLELAVMFSVLLSAAKAVAAKGLKAKVPDSKAPIAIVNFLIINRLLQFYIRIIPQKHSHVATKKCRCF